MNGMLKCGIPNENVRVFDQHKNMSADEPRSFDVVYLCVGRTAYLLERINDTGFREALLSYIREGGFIIGVSAGSIIFTNDLPNNLGLIGVKLEVHCENGEQSGKVTFPLKENIMLSNTAAMLIRSIPDNVEIIDGK